MKKIIIPADQMPESLSCWVETVLPWIRDEVAPSTFNSYHAALENHILPRLGHLSLEEIEPAMVNELILDLCSKRSSCVASQARSALGKVMSLAVSRGAVAKNPVKLARPTACKYQKASMSVRADVERSSRRLNLAEGAHLLRKVRGSIAYWPILLCLRFGLHLVEALGLKWSDVDLEAQVVRVRRPRYVRGESRRLSAPGSETGVRNVPIAADLLVSFAEAKARAAELGHEWVCVDESGKPHQSTPVSRTIRDALVAAGFDWSEGKPVPKIHDLRLSFLNWLANHANSGAGVKPHALMRIAGLSELAEAMRYYDGASHGDLASAVNSLYMDLSEQEDLSAHLDEVLEDEAA